MNSKLDYVNYVLRAAHIFWLTDVGTLGKHYLDNQYSVMRLVDINYYIQNQQLDSYQSSEKY